MYFHHLIITVDTLATAFTCGAHLGLAVVKRPREFIPHRNVRPVVHGSFCGYLGDIQTELVVADVPEQFRTVGSYDTAASVIGVATASSNRRLAGVKVTLRRSNVDPLVQLCGV